MTTQNLNTFSLLIKENSDLLLSEWREEVKKLPLAQDLETPTLNDHIPDLIEELAYAISDDCTDKILLDELKNKPILHGLDRLRIGFNVDEIVAEYNAIRYVVIELIHKKIYQLNAPEIHTINRIIDRSIALAVTAYTEKKALDIKNRRAEHLSFVVHDLRTPLTIIGITTTLLKKSLEKGIQTDSARYLEELQHNVIRLNTLIVQVVQEEVDQTSKRKLMLEEVTLKPLVEELLQNMKSLADVSETILVNDVPEKLTAFADPNLLTLIFQNLISNAINYTGKGIVTVGANNLKELAVIECWVRDTGIGISEDDMKKVFDKLETSGKKGGMGLGLAIVKKFVEAHSGKVSVNSTPGLGSTFRFTLPYDPRAKK
jgi:two-component system phosphate regulon sensor histidine kinase PhoR